MIRQHTEKCTMKTISTMVGEELNNHRQNMMIHIRAGRRIETIEEGTISTQNNQPIKKVQHIEGMIIARKHRVGIIMMTDGTMRDGLVESNGQEADKDQRITIGVTSIDDQEIKKGRDRMRDLKIGENLGVTRVVQGAGERKAEA